MPCDLPPAAGRRPAAPILAVVAALLLLAGCGTPSATPGAGAPPFSDAPAPGSASAATPGLLEYPTESLTIHYSPRLRADRKDAVLAYGAFQAALQRAVRTGKISADLKRRTEPQELVTLRKQIAIVRKESRGRWGIGMTVNKVTLKSDTAGRGLCTTTSSTTVPAFVVMTRHHRTYRVLALGPDKSRKTC
jgi:hypothetical protein